MEDAVDALAEGQCYTNTVGPFTMSDDRDLIEVCADNPNEIEESNETNNCRENVFEYQGPSYQPDLTVKTNVTFDEDGNIIVNYTVTNRGSSKAGNSTTCLYVDNTKLQAPSDLSVTCEPKTTQSMFCPGLGIGESHTGTFDPVEYLCNKILTVTVCADYNEAVKESNETNNCEQKRVECPECKKPDLVVTKNKVEENNGIFIVSYTVTNIGGGTAGESTTCMSVEKASYTSSNLAVQCEPDDPWHQSQSCPELKPDKSHNGKFKFEECPCGEKLNVTVCADYNEAVKESNETNNCLATELECPPCGPTESYGKKVQSRRNVLYAQGALGEPDDRGALMYRNSKIAIKLEDTIPNCERVSVWVRRVAGQAPKFTVAVSSDGKSWTKIGTETCTSFGWALYDFNANGEDVKYIRITKHGSSSRRWWQQLKLMGLDAVYAEGKPN
ncbi:MAG: hypothetical protein C5S38_08865 [Candidatus Methanophagaceae archaeon]|nr:MAG: hypothetical protein C5S38_08865 [Methanophagales archaeon]